MRREKIDKERDTHWSVIQKYEGARPHMGGICVGGERGGRGVSVYVCVFVCGGYAHVCVPMSHTYTIHAQDIACTTTINTNHHHLTSLFLSFLLSLCGSVRACQSASLSLSSLSVSLSLPASSADGGGDVVS